jgi:hypothetical protein
MVGGAKEGKGYNVTVASVPVKPSIETQSIPKPTWENYQGIDILYETQLFYCSFRQTLLDFHELQAIYPIFLCCIHPIDIYIPRRGPKI